MNISPIKFSTSFKGARYSYDSSKGEEGLKGLPDFYRSSSVEKTLGAYHTKPKNAVYFADPLEPITDSIRDRVDFIVYDNEPSYPKLEDVRRNYLENNRVNYRDAFEDVRNYYYRREMGGFANIDEAKYQQWQAAECTGLYDKAGSLRYQKEKAEDLIQELSADRANIVAGKTNTEQELKLQKELNKNIQKQIDTLKNIRKPYASIEFTKKEVANEADLFGKAAARLSDVAATKESIKELENTAYFNEGMEAYPSIGLKYGKYQNTTQTYSEINKMYGKTMTLLKAKTAAQKQLEGIDSAINEFLLLQATCKNTIQEMTQYIESLTGKIAKIDKDIAERKSFIEDCRSKLKPLFEELSAFYKKQGIKVIKK